MLSAAARRGVGLRAATPMAYRSLASLAPTPVGSHIKVEIKDDVGIIRVDMADSRMNVLSRALMTEFVSALDKLDAASVKAAVITSGKPDFIAGADINMLAAAKTSQELVEVRPPPPALPLETKENPRSDHARPVPFPFLSLF